MAKEPKQKGIEPFELDNDLEQEEVVMGSPELIAAFQDEED